MPPKSSLRLARTAASLASRLPPSTELLEQSACACVKQKLISVSHSFCRFFLSREQMASQMKQKTLKGILPTFAPLYFGSSCLLRRSSSSLSSRSSSLSRRPPESRCSSGGKRPEDSITGCGRRRERQSRLSSRRHGVRDAGREDGRSRVGGKSKEQRHKELMDQRFLWRQID